MTAALLALLVTMSQESFEEITAAFATRHGVVVDARWSEEIEVGGFSGAGGARICGPDHARRICIAGGLARHPLVDADGLLLVLCHELGHYERAHAATLATIEEEADYYATSSCFEGQDGLATALRMARYSKAIWEGLGMRDVPEPSLERRAAPRGDPAQCRLDIWRAGLLGEPRPPCDWG